jgi:hypothetical protein
MSEIPQWAVEKAVEASGFNYIDAAADENRYRTMGIIGDIAVRRSLDAFARYISEHEEGPVDPLLVEAREIAIEFYKDSNPALISSIRDGSEDQWLAIRMTHEGLKRGKELAGER